MTAEDQVTAAELALGLLEGEERAAAIARVLAEPAFGAEVTWWRVRFATLAEDYDPAEPPERLAARVDALIADGSPAPRARRWPWAVGGAAGGALAAGLATLLLVPAAPPPSPRPAPVAAAPLLVAVLAPAAGEHRAAVAAVVDSAAGVIRLAAAVETPRGRSAELWRIGTDGVPRALGLADAARPVALAIARAGLPLAGDTLALSIEPAGGSPTGAPTGPVVATGVLARG